MKILNQFIAIFINLSPTSSHLGKFRLERVKVLSIYLTIKSGIMIIVMYNTDVCLSIDGFYDNRRALIEKYEEHTCQYCWLD